jgi:lipopolysaccharide/colanic/teichoic acid biosynthesis glycosyltransferase/glycosyltransferase involved in cell wall biosynthesis
MSALRILHLGKYYPPDRGGIETVVETLCRGERADVDTRALVLNKVNHTADEVLDEVPVRRVASVATIGAVSIAPALPLWLSRAEADVIVLHEPNPMALLAYALARPKAPLIVWIHSEVIRPQLQYRLFYEPLLEFALRRAQRIVVASPPMLRIPALARYQRKCTVIPYGLEPTRYRLSSTTASRVKAIRVRTSAQIVLFVGRLVPYKGVDVLLRAMKGLDAETIVVGDGPCRMSLTALACDLGVIDRVRFVGEVSEADLQGWYHACDVLVLPSVSRQEAFGMVQLEAMLCGHPVVSTDLQTGTSWVNQHERTGLVVTAGDVNGLRDALSRLLADPQLRDELGDAGRARVKELFTVETMCRQTVSLYGEVARSFRVPTGLAEPWRRRVTCRIRMAAKRALDIGLSGIGLIASSPLWAIIAVLIKLEDGGPVFYGQQRSGLNGVPFDVKKFRSMIPDAEARVGAIQATEHDPRVTRVGRVLRATAMDELPQLWNIFRGDMSFTGPRALRPGEIEVGGRGVVEKLEDVPGFDERSSVRPGLTGIAQIYAPRDITRRWKFRYDLIYVRRPSFWLDVRLILLSFWITFRGSWEARGSKLTWRRQTAR